MQCGFQCQLTIEGDSKDFEILTEILYTMYAMTPLFSSVEEHATMSRPPTVQRGLAVLEFDPNVCLCNSSSEFLSASQVVSEGNLQEPFRPYPDTQISKMDVPETRAPHGRLVY